MGRLELQRIRDAVASIDPVFLDTPLYEAPPLSAAVGCSLLLKVETLNPVGCFKGRGSEVITSSLVRAGHSAVVCASAGNLGQAVAFSAARRDLAATVFAAASANPLKVARMRALGAAVHLEGADIEEPRRLARSFAAAEGAALIEDSLDVGTCEGAGTIGLELAGAGHLDAVLVALGAGALATGVGHVLRELSPTTEVVAIQPVGAPAMALSWRAGRVIDTESIDTIADGVAGRHPIPEVLDDLLEVVDDVVVVAEESIVAGMRLVYELAGLVVEPSAVLGIAALLEEPDRFRGRRVATIVCGRNVVPADFERWVSAARHNT